MGSDPGAADDDFTDSDQAWWDHLTGRPAAAPASERTQAAALEAEALRVALQPPRRAPRSEAEIAAATSDGARAQRWQQLQFRLRREGLLNTERRWYRRPALGLAVAASLVGALVLVRPPAEEPIYDEPATLRGEQEQLLLADAQPRQAAERLAASLRAAGVPAVLHQNGKVFGVDTVLTPASAPAAVQALHALGVKTSQGAVRVAFEPAR